MKTLQNFIVAAAISLTGVFLPITTASAIDEPSYFVPIQPCRLFNTRNMQSAAFPNGGPDPFVATKVRTPNVVMYDSKNFVINDVPISGAVEGQGGAVDPNTGNPICDIPDNALALHINLIATLSEGGDSWLRVWPYAGTNPGEADFATANVMVWNNIIISNATPISLADETGFRFTLRAFFNVSSDPTHPENFSTHITGDVLGYYLPFSP